MLSAHPSAPGGGKALDVRRAVETRIPLTRRQSAAVAGSATQSGADDVGVD